jgi:murein DD-endopeptidase MepM/ murein hydrolase activator NlpD
MKVLQSHKLRIDRAGNGSFGATRRPYNPDGSPRLHKGVDLVSVKGEPVYAPFSGKIRNGIVSAVHTNRKLVEVTSSKGDTVKLMYVEPVLNNGATVKKGDIVGTAQHTGELYNTGSMLPHVHVELYKNEVLQDPTKELFQEQKKS